MKVKTGGSISLTINMGNYESLKVESDLEIEKDIEESEIEEQQEKTYKMLESDIQNKAKKAFLKFHGFKESLKEINKS